MPLSPSQQTKIAGVSCWDEAVKEEWVMFGKSSATRTVLCDWADRVALINGIMGQTTTNLASQPHYQDPAAYPDAPQALQVAKINVEGVMGKDTGLSVGGNGMVAYPYARCMIQYASLPYDPKNVNVVSVDYGVEEVSVPGLATYQFTNFPAIPVDQSVFPSLRVCTVTITIQQFNQPLLPTKIVASVAGCVNQASLFGFDDPQTVLFAGAKSNRRVNSAGQVNQDMCYQFQYNINGWNNKICPGKNPLWQPVRNIATHNPPFTVADLSVLGIKNASGLVP